MAEQPQPPLEPGLSTRNPFGGAESNQTKEELRRDAEQRANRGIQRRISGIFGKAFGGVKLRPPELSHLTSAVVSRAANVRVFGQNLTSSLDYALHHKKEMVTNTVQYALTHKAEIASGVVGGQIGKTAARAVLTGTLAGAGGFLGGAVIGAVGGGLAGATKEYFKQREGIQINEAEKALVIAGLINEFRRIKGANKEEIRNAAIRGAIVGAVGGVIGVGITDFVANNEWVQEQISKIRLSAAPPPAVPVIHAPDFPAPESPPVAEVTPVPAAPTVGPTSATPGPVAAPTATVEAPAAASTAVPTAEATATPVATATPTGTPIPTETPAAVPATPTPGATPESAAAVQPPAAPKPEMPAAPPPAPAEVSPPAPPAPPAPEPAPVPPAPAPAVPAPEVPAAPPVELTALPEQVPLPAGSNPWEVTSRTLHDVLGRAPTNAEILQVTKEICRQSNIAVPNWEITGEIDHRALPVDYKLVFNDPVKKLIAGMKG